MEKELVAEKTKAVKTEIANAELAIGFYTWLADKTEDKETAAKYRVKADQLKESKTFNETFLEYIETL